MGPIRLRAPSPSTYEARGCFHLIKDECPGVQSTVSGATLHVSVTTPRGVLADQLIHFPPDVSWGEGGVRTAWLREEGSMAVDEEPRALHRSVLVITISRNSEIGNLIKQVCAGPQQYVSPYHRDLYCQRQAHKHQSFCLLTQADSRIALDDLITDFARGSTRTALYPWTRRVDSFSSVRGGLLRRSTPCFTT